MHYKCLTHHVWRTIPPKFELYSCSENLVESLISLYQFSDLYVGIVKFFHRKGRILKSDMEVELKSINLNSGCT